MDVRRLQLLARVIEMGSITRASASLGIAQPALSQHIQNLERSAGAALLHRTHDGVAPTEAGLIAYRNAKLIARQLELARIEVSTLATTPAGRVTVGIAPHSRARGLMMPLLKKALQAYPEILIHVNENFEGKLSEGILRGQIDMALLYEVVPRSGIWSKVVVTETLALIGVASLFHAADASGRPPPLLLPAIPNAVRQLVDAIYGDNPQQPGIQGEIESFETLRDAVCEGLGVTILPRSIASQLSIESGLETRPFGTVDTTLSLSLATGDPALLSPAAKVIHSLVETLVEGWSNGPLIAQGAK